MLKLSKYLKPYILPIIIAVGLLYVQVNMDLALPDYMSRIINTGIQHGGISEIFPEVIKENSLDEIKLFLDNDNKNMVKILFSSELKSSLEHQYNYGDEEVLFLDRSITTTDEFKLSFSTAIMIVSQIEKMGLVPENMELLRYMNTIPIEEKSAIITQVSGIIMELNDKFVIQGAKSLIKKEYEALGVNTVSIQNMYILTIGGKMLLMTLLSAICAVSVGFIASKTSAGTAKSLRGDLFTKVESFSNAEFDKFSTASLITRSTNDITQIQNVVFMILRMVIYAPLLGIGGFTRAMGKASSMGWLIGLAVIVLLGFISIIVAVSMPKFKKIQDLVDRLNLVTRENLSGLMVVRAFNRQKFEESRFDKANRNLTDTNLFVMRTMVVAMPVIMLIMNGLSVSIIWIGAHQVASGAMQVGDMMAFIQYAMQIVMSFMMLSMVLISFPRASVSAKRISEVLDMNPSVLDPKNPQILPEHISGDLEFKNVSFRYPGGEVDALSNISFIAKHGTTTAFIGSTGSGKSTIVNLIPRFYDVTEGEITLDGMDIRDLGQHNLRSVIGFVPQKNVLFSGTIRSNLQYGNKNGTDEDMNESVKIAQAADFIAEKKESYDFVISQDGSNVSGGQRQRLAISRALMKKSPLYVFDDSFSALDFKTDSLLRKALKTNTGESTIILVAQRVATIMSAEQIIVLEDGRIVGKGTHKELMKSCTEYSEIAISQLGLQEEV